MPSQREQALAKAMDTGKMDPNSSQSMQNNQHAHNTPLPVDSEQTGTADEHAKLIMQMSESGKQALGGLLACCMALVNDGSESRIWAQTYFRFLAESCCELPASAVEGYLPMVITPRSRTKHLDTQSSATELDALSQHSRPFVEILQEELTKEEIVQLLYIILWRTTHTVGYDARTRTLLRLVTAQLDCITWSMISEEEVVLARALILEVNELSTKKKIPNSRNWGDWKRNMAIGGAAVAGGTLLALTGGLATPFIAAGFSALGGAGAAIGTVLASSGVVTAATVLFGTAGAGLAGYKADRRTLGIKQFDFELLTPGDGMHVYICVAGWLDDENKVDFSSAFGTTREYIRAFYELHCPDKLSFVDSLVDRYKGREDVLVSVLCKEYNIPEGTDPVTIHLEDTHVADDTTNTATVHSPGQLRGWRWKHRMPNGDQYCLHWEKDILKKFGHCMKAFTTEMLMGYAQAEVVKLTALAALYAAVALPKMVVNVCNMIDSDWVMVMNRADKCGILLAKTLLERQQGLRPVSLIGYGMGARVIFECLKHLANEGDKGLGIVENAVVLGAAIPVVPTEWNAVRNVVAGRLINGYSKNDWILAIMFRYQNFSLGAAGICPIEVDGVENFNLSSIINGHMEYPNKLGLILELMQLES